MRRTDVYQIRCAPEEKAAWIAAADGAGMTLADWIRDQLGCLEEPIAEVPRVVPERPKRKVRVVTSVRPESPVEANQPTVSVPPRVNAAALLAEFKSPKLELCASCRRKGGHVKGCQQCKEIG